MARGQFRAFNKGINSIGAKGFDLSDGTDYKIMLITTLPVVTEATLLDSTDYTEVSPLGSVYTAGGLALAVTWNEAAGVNTWDSTVNPGWVQDLSGPTDVVAGLVYSTTEVGDDAVGFFDLTVDGGTTAISLQAGDITVTLPATGMFNISRP